MSCTEITTTDDGINKIGKFTIDNDGDVARIKYSTQNILTHNTASSNTVLAAGNQLFFSAGGSTQGRFTTTGLRIGNGTPSEKLDVIGNALISGNITATEITATTVNISNISAINLSATSITAPDVQPTLIAGNNMTIVGTTISATGGTPDLTNISNTNLSSVNITATQIISTSVLHKNDFARFRANNRSFNNTYTFYDIQYVNTGLNNSLLTAGGTNNDTFTVTKAGFYFILTDTAVVQNSYNNRVCWRIRHLVNGVYNALYGETFTYTRHDDYGEFGGLSLSSVIELAVGDTFSCRLEIKKNTDNIGSEMSGCLQLGSHITFQYLGA